MTCREAVDTQTASTSSVMDNFRHIFEVERREKKSHIQLLLNEAQYVTSSVKWKKQIQYVITTGYLAAVRTGLKPARTVCYQSVV